MKVKFSDIATFIAGQSPESQFYSETEGTPFLQGNRTFGMFYPTIDTYTKKVTKTAHEGDILMSVRAPVGDLNFAPCDLCIGRGLSAINAKDGDNAFLFYALKYNIRALLNQSNGTTYDAVTGDDIRQMDMILPDDKDIYPLISKLLRQIDEKIENNTVICSDLEAMAKLLYDYWFIQFDFPDENGKPYKSSGGKMVWNEELKREIPEGWSVKPLAALIADSKNGDWGDDAPKKRDDIEVKCFRGADFPSITEDYAVTAPIRYISAKNADRLLCDGDLVTEISGGSPTQSTGRVGYINQKFLNRNNGKMTCSNFCKAFTPSMHMYQYWIYQTWKSLYDAGVMFNYESKTTGIKNLMFDEFITWIHVPVPTDDLVTKYQETCSQYYNKIQDEFIESAELASLRDFLLPMLMNGQVKVG